MTSHLNPYLPWITQFDEWAKAGRDLPLGGLNAHPASKASPDAGKVLLFSPHPDDECITGALPLRLAREAGLQIVNVAVTLGSNKARQAARWSELQKACSFLNWSVECSTPGGLSRITPKARVEEPDHWSGAVEVIQNILTRHQPKFVVFPHSTDWNASHIGTHHLVMDALASLPAGFGCGLVETEFWGAMATPNLMVESSVSEVADLVAALSLHVGEVQRNPYHLTLPAWMQDTVRRGGEIVGGQGGASPDYRFATLYRAGLWRDRARHDLAEGSARFLPTGEGVMKQWLEDVSWK
jgi:LmbE family N-acetylglucosaminyl deacetylase